jgi:hypothetical protein
MGVSIGFISATTEELDRAEKDPSWADEYVYELYAGNDFPNRPHGGPDKAWAGLQFLIDETDVDLEFLMDGFQILEDGTLFGWSPEQIESVARYLRATPWERLAAHYAPERMTVEEVYPKCGGSMPRASWTGLSAPTRSLSIFSPRRLRADMGRS